MASFFALSQTRPPKIDVPVLRDAMKLTPVWHNLRTAYQNQHRLVLAGLPLAAIFSAASIVIKPKKRRVVLAYTIAAGVLIALAANALDCCWLFRLRPEWIGTQTIIRSIPWIIIAAISMLFTTGKERAEHRLHRIPHPQRVQKPVRRDVRHENVKTLWLTILAVLMAGCQSTGTDERTM